ncbi:MAG: glycosyltransferase family 4 protein [Candidatus Micrarchaeota archaeon]
MKVGILCPFFRPDAIGGVETVIRHLLERLPEHGFSPSIVPFSLPNNIDFNNPLFSPYLQFKAATAAISRETSGFDIIHSHNPFVTLPFALRKKTVMSVHVYSGDLYASRSGIHPVMWAQRNGMHLAEYASGMAAREITTVSTHIKSRLVQDVHMPEKKIAVIYNGVDLDAIGEAIDAASQIPFETEGPNILCLGRVWRPKGIDIVLRSLASEGFRNAHLYVAGPLEDKPYVEEMREFASKAGLAKRFHLLGPISEPQKYALMHHADLVILPSRFEGLSIVAIEALASSSAIIASDISPLREVLGDAAIYFKAGDKHDLAEKISTALSGDNVASALRKKVGKRSRLFSISRMVDGYLRAYERAAA